MRIYADHAATTPMCEASIAAMTECMKNCYGNPSAIYQSGIMAKKAIQKAREIISDGLGADANEIVFTSGGSESDNQAIISAASYGEGSGKKHIITTAIEHHAVLNTVKSLRAKGFDITFLNVSPDGIVNVSELKKAMREDTCLVSVMYANNEIGTIQPISEIGALCREKGILFHTDAVQAAGHIPINVITDKVDYLALSAHKFGGPKGVGALYIRNGAPVSSLICGGGQEGGKRAGTENVPGITGMAAAFGSSLKNLDEDMKRITDLRNTLIDGLSKIPGAVLNGNRSNRVPGIVNFSFEGVRSAPLLFLLDAKEGIAVSSGSACNTGSVLPSHVLSAIGCSKDMANGALRISLGTENTKEDVLEIISAVSRSIEYLKSKNK